MRPDRAVDQVSSGGIAITAGQTVSLSSDLVLDAAREADVSPRPNGNGQISLADWVQIGRFAAFLDNVNNGPEFRRADCAPVATGGDGRITLADWVQAGRYAAALDPVRQVTGPEQPTPFANLDILVGSPQAIRRHPHKTIEFARRALLSPTPASDAEELHYSLNLHGRGDENAFAFTLEIDADRLKLLAAEPTNDSAIIHINETKNGRIGIVLALPPGKSFGGGEHQVMVLRFANLRRSTILPAIQFADGVVGSEIVTVEAESVPAVFGVEAGRALRFRE